MKRSMFSLAFLAAALLAFAACDDKKTDTTKQDDPSTKNASGVTTTTTANTVATAAPQPVTIDDKDLATPADFEEAAEKSITKANYKTQLSTLESDIAKE